MRIKDEAIMKEKAMNDVDGERRFSRPIVKRQQILLRNEH